MGQEDEGSEVDSRVYQFLDLLHQRGWGSPLTQSEQHDSPQEDEESYGGREYDSPSSSRVVTDLLGCSRKLQGSAAARCVVEFALRGVNKSNKRSDASKIVRGLEGLTRDEVTGSNKPGSLALSVGRVSEVLRIKRRTRNNTGKREEAKVRHLLRQLQSPLIRYTKERKLTLSIISFRIVTQAASSEDPFSTSMFNLGLTDRQREEKERVELPFTRGGGEANGSGAIIIYEPDSADDLDDSDPDEDLEI